MPEHFHKLCSNWFVLSWWKNWELWTKCNFLHALHLFSISCFASLNFMFSCHPCYVHYANLHFFPSIHFFVFLWTPCFISAHSSSPSPQIYHLKDLDHSTSHRPSSPSSSSSSSSASISSCWYSPSVWPSGEECYQYILWALVAVYLLLFFTSTFLVFFSDHPTTCHCGPHHNPTRGPGPQHGVPLPSMGSNDSQCKSISQCLGRNHWR